MELLFIKHGVTTLSHFNCRYSAIHCASAVPMSSVELQQARDISRAPAVEPEQKKTVANGDMKPLAKPQKGIMGMFGNKAAPKAVDSNKDVKPEPKEEEQAATVSFFLQKSNSNFFFVVSYLAALGKLSLSHFLPWTSLIFNACEFWLFRRILKRANQQQKSIQWPTFLETKQVRWCYGVITSTHRLLCVWINMERWNDWQQLLWMSLSCVGILELFITPTEKPDKSLDVKVTVQPSSSSPSVVEPENQNTKKPEEKQESAAVEPPKAKEPRRFVFFQCSEGILRRILLCVKKREYFDVFSSCMLTLKNVHCASSELLLCLLHMKQNKEDCRFGQRGWQNREEKEAAD